MGFSLGSAVSALAGTGVALKSKHQYERGLDLEQQADESHVEEMRAARNHNAEGDVRAGNITREAQIEQESRDMARDWMKQPAAAPQPPAPAPQSELPQDIPLEQAAPPVDDTPPPQPTIASAYPGSTLSLPKARAPRPAPAAPVQTPAGAPSFAAPYVAEEAAPVAAPKTRMGLLEAQIEHARTSGHAKLEASLTERRDHLEKEGFGKAAHAALRDWQDTASIEKIMNSTGTIRILPGSLRPKMAVVDGKSMPTGVYSGDIVGPDGKPNRRDNIDFNRMAIDVGAIAPPTLTAYPAGSNVYSKDRLGNATKVQGAEAWTAGPRDSGFIFNKTNGEIKSYTTAGGKTVKLSADETHAITEINRTVDKEAKAREDFNVMAPDEKKMPAMNRIAVTSIAQSIFINNPNLRKEGGLNGSEAVKVADLAVQGKETADFTPGWAVIDGVKWNVAMYGKGKDKTRYLISKAPGQDTPQPVTAPTAPAGPARKPALDQNSPEIRAAALRGQEAERAATPAVVTPSGAQSAPPPPSMRRSGVTGTPIPMPSLPTPAPGRGRLNAYTPGAQAPAPTPEVQPDVSSHAITPMAVADATDSASAAKLASQMQQRYQAVQWVKRHVANGGIKNLESKLSGMDRTDLQYALSAPELSAAEKSTILAYLKR